MRIRKLWIEGYGRFTGAEVGLSDGLQVVAGPNERGKSTLRSFIGDMLYGQKRSPLQRLYDDSNELRTPWNGHDHYGGRLLYRLDDGREIEVVRRFDRKDEFVQVFDRTHGREITQEFPRLRNREPLFAEEHTGLAKDVFQHVATITHATLEMLGDQGALNQIREKLLSLADTADEGVSAETALRRLQARAATIGTLASRTRPLPAARARLAELRQEYEDACELRRELAGLDAEQRELAAGTRELQARRETLEASLKAHERRRRTNRLMEAEELSRKITANIEICSSLGAAREFPLEGRHEIQRLENVAATARLQLERSLRECEALKDQIRDENERLGPDGAAAMEEIPESIEEQLTEYEQKGLRLQERIDELHRESERARKVGAEAYRQLALLPDFSRVTGDPVAQFTDAASSCQAAQRAVDEARVVLENARNEAHQCHEAAGELHALFAHYEDFPAESRDYQLKQELHDQHTGQLMSHKEALHNFLLEQQGRLPGLRTLAVVCLLLAVGASAAAVVFQNPGALLPAALCGLGVIYYVLGMAQVRKTAAQAREEERQAEQELAELQAEYDERRARMQAILEQAGCETVRELEALYDRHHERLGEAKAAQAALEAQEARLKEAEARAAEALEQARARLTLADQPPPEIWEVREASARAAAEYQQYRDLKRQVFEQHDVLKKCENECQAAETALRRLQDEERGLALEVRRLMRENGFPDERNHASARSALRAYRIRSAQWRSRRARIELLHEKRTCLEAECRHDEAALAKHQQAFDERLRQAGVDSPEAWRRRADEARVYQELCTERRALEGQLRAVLQGEPIEALREQVQAQGPGDDAPGDPAVLRRELDETTEAIERRRERDHALQLTLTQRAANMRLISEIEEERAAAEQRVDKLELELEATDYAASVIEEVARDRHARIAPRLAKRASAYLNEITGGVYEELFISRDLHLSVRIPQTQTLKEDPERRLSKGTVDQIYFALRMAMVQSLSEHNESIPMLLDDPFANYDDDRLARTMHLLARAAQNNQILLFTCREDVIRAAEEAGAPIVRL